MILGLVICGHCAAATNLDGRERQVLALVTYDTVMCAAGPAPDCVRL